MMNCSSFLYDLHTIFFFVIIQKPWWFTSFVLKVSYLLTNPLGSSFNQVSQIIIQSGLYFSIRKFMKSILFMLSDLQFQPMQIKRFGIGLLGCTFSSIEEVMKFFINPVFRLCLLFLFSVLGEQVWMILLFAYMLSSFINVTIILLCFFLYSFIFLFFIA